MAGMLPGVEAARRRRFHNTPHPTSLPLSHTRNVSIRQKGGLCDDESKLVAAAKKRLDQRFQPQWREHTKSKQNSRCMCKMSNWLKIRWKSWEEEECAVCLEQFKLLGKSKTLMQLPCRHRFHTKCLVPWLDGNAHCPCCRMPIPSSICNSLSK